MDAERILSSFLSDGFVVQSSVVSERACNDALRAVGRRMEKGGEKKEFVTDGSVVGLFNECEALRQTVALLLGLNASAVPPALAAQVALRFPGTLCDEQFRPVPFWASLWHIDGLPSDENGIKQGTIKNFTLLIGVCLRDVLEDFHGNLVVFPRSHWVLAEYFRNHGFETAKSGLKQLPALPLAAPVQVKLRKGDVVFAHYNLAHSIAPNMSVLLSLCSG